MDYRIEHDSMGEMKVPADRYWAAQTQRSHENFEIGVGIEIMPREITRAFGILKKAAALANHALKPEKMTEEKLSAMLDDQLSSEEEDLMDDLGLDMQEIVRTMAKQARELPKDDGKQP